MISTGQKSRPLLSLMTPPPISSWEITCCYIFVAGLLALFYKIVVVEDAWSTPNFVLSCSVISIVCDPISSD